MKTTRLNLSRAEVKAILPGLDLIVGRVVAMRGTSFSGVIPAIDAGKDIFVTRRYDRQMYEHLLSARKKLKSIPPSRKVRLNAFELSVVALGLRVTRREKLRAADPAFVVSLEKKVETYRKRAKRAEVGESGALHYIEFHNCWRRFLQWLRHDILYRARRISRAVAIKRRQDRERIRSFALEVVVETADRKQILQFADLARREVKRGRHEYTLIELLKNDDNTRLFLSKFLLKRVPFEWIRPEFLPEALRNSLKSHIFESAKVTNQETRTTRVGPTALQASVPERHSLEKRVVSTSTDRVQKKSMTPPPQELTEEELALRVANWLLTKVDVQYWELVCGEIREDKRLSVPRHRAWIASHTVEESFTEISRPPCDEAGVFAETEMYSEWGARSVLLLSSDLVLIKSAVELGLDLAYKEKGYTKWDKPHIYQRQTWS